MRSLTKNHKAQMAVALGGMIALLVAIIIGVLVFYEINDNVSIDNAQTGANGSSWVKYRSARNSTNDTAETVFTLLPIIAIVLIASIILAVVSGFGGIKGGGL